MSKRTRYLEFGTPRVHRRPADATPADLVDALGQAALGRGLPRGWEVDQPYRNSASGSWKSLPVEQMIEDSADRGGDFIGIYLNRFLGRQAQRLGVTLGQPREATPEEAEAFRRREERVSEREAGEFEELAKKQKRSAAAKKGAETRRRRKEEEAARKAEAARKRKARKAEAERKAKAEARKRAAAAKRGWETRRANERARELAKRKRSKGKRK